MKQKLIIIGNGFTSLFFIGRLLTPPVYPVFTAFLRRLYARYDITVIGNGRFVYFPAIPEFITVKNLVERLYLFYLRHL